MINTSMPEECDLKCGVSTHGLKYENNIVKYFNIQEDLTTSTSDYYEKKCVLLMTDIQKLVHQLKLERVERENTDSTNLRELKGIISILEQTIEAKEKEIKDLNENNSWLLSDLHEKTMRVAKLELPFSSQPHHENVTASQFIECKQLNVELKRKITKLEEERTRLLFIEEQNRNEILDSQQSLVNTKSLIKQQNEIIESLKSEIKQLKRQVRDVSDDLREVRDIHDASITFDPNCPSRLSIDQIVRANNSVCEFSNRIEHINPKKFNNSPKTSTLRISFKRRNLILDQRINEADESMEILHFDDKENIERNKLSNCEEAINISKLYCFNEDPLKSSSETKNFVPDEIQTDNIVQFTSHSPIILNFSHLSNMDNPNEPFNTSFGCQTSDISCFGCQNRLNCQTEDFKTPFIRVSGFCQTSNIDRLSQSCQTDEKTVQRLSHGCQTDDKIAKQLLQSCPYEERYMKQLSYRCQFDEQNTQQLSKSCQIDEKTVHQLMQSCPCEKRDIQQLSHSCQTKESNIQQLQLSCQNEMIIRNDDLCIPRSCQTELENEALDLKEIETIKKEMDKRDCEISRLKKEVHDQRLRVLDVKYDMREIIVSLQCKITELNETIANYNNNENERNAEVEWQKKENMWQHHLEDASIKYSQLEMQIQALKENNGSAETQFRVQIESLNEEINKYKQALERLHSANRNLEADFDLSMTSAEKAEAKYKEYRASTERKIFDLTDALKRGKLESEKCRSEMQTWKDKYEELKILLVRMEHQISTYKNALDQQANIIKRHSEEVFMNGISSSEYASTSDQDQIILNVDLTNLTLENQNLISKYSNLQAECVRLKEITKNYEKKIDESEKQIRNLQMKQEQLNDEIKEQKKLFESVGEKSNKRLSQLVIEGNTYKKVANEKESKVLELLQQFKNESHARKRSEEKLNELELKFKKLKSETDMEKRDLGDEISHKNNEIANLNEKLNDLEEKHTMLKYEREKLLSLKETNEAELHLLKEEVSIEITRLSKLKFENVRLVEEIELKSNIIKSLTDHVDALKNENNTLKANSELNKIKFEGTIAQQVKLIDFLKAKVDSTPRKHRLFSANKIEESKNIH